MIKSWTCRFKTSEQLCYKGTKQTWNNEDKYNKKHYTSLTFSGIACAITSYLWKGLSWILVLVEEALGNISSLTILYSKASISRAEELKNNWIPLMSKHVRSPSATPHILEKTKSERNYINQIHFHYYNISEALSLRQNAIKPHLFFLILQRVADITWYWLGLHGVRVWMTSTSLKAWNHVCGSHWDD